MNTPAHLVVNLAALAGESRRRHLVWVAAGALIPDLGMFGFFAYQYFVARTPMATIWSESYFDPAWQLFFDLWNSLPLLLLALAVAYYKRRQVWILLFASAILHVLLDLPVHREDGHRHLWPLTDWRFMSPISYWDPAHGGALGSLLELLLVGVASVVLWRRHRQRTPRVALVLYNAAKLFGWLSYYGTRLIR